MSDPPYHIWVSWRHRLETAIECARRLAHMFEGLAAAHPCFARWNKQAETRKAANAPFCAMPREWTS